MAKEMGAPERPTITAMVGRVTLSSHSGRADPPLESHGVKANRALDAALALARNPGLAASMRGRPLPSGIPLLLQLLAGKSDVASSAAEALKLDERSVRFAVEHYVQTVMLFAGAEPQRVLGVAPGATRGEMRTHLRWLMHWLHPDHNAAAWRSAFASRVLTAWREASSSDAVRKRARGPRLVTLPAESVALGRRFRFIRRDWRG